MPSKRNTEKKKHGFQSWSEATRVAKERSKWRELVKDPIVIKQRRKQVNVSQYFARGPQIIRNSVLMNLILIKLPGKIHYVKMYLCHIFTILGD